MCIIAAKPAGFPMPKDDILENMWYANPDGAGFMYAADGYVHIEKGFMRFADFLAALDRLSMSYDLSSLAMVMHFRITTHGGTKPENTHPFPVTDNLPSLKKLHGKTKLAVAHNGIIDITPRSKDISDTMEYVASQLAPLHRALPEFYKNKHAMLMVSNAIQSKMVFLTGKGEMYTIGKFETEDGMLYSNTSYKGWYASWRRGNWGQWDTSSKSWSTGSLLKDIEDDFPTDYSASKTVGEDNYEMRRLMPLWIVDGMVIDPEGTMLEGDEFYVDPNNELWWYSWDDDTAFQCDAGWQYYTKDGLPIKYKAEESESVWCLVEEAYYK